jgi:hypothetical protein
MDTISVPTVSGRLAGAACTKLNHAIPAMGLLAAGCRR